MCQFSIQNQTRMLAPVNSSYVYLFFSYKLHLIIQKISACYNCVISTPDFNRQKKKHQEPGIKLLKVLKIMSTKNIPYYKKLQMKAKQLYKLNYFDIILLKYFYGSSWMSIHIIIIIAIFFCDHHSTRLGFLIL